MINKTSNCDDIIRCTCHDFKRVGRERLRTDRRVPAPCCNHHLEHPKGIWKAVEGLQQGSGKQQGNRRAQGRRREIFRLFRHAGFPHVRDEVQGLERKAKQHKIVWKANKVLGVC